jgi:hypothetical protein
MDEERACRGKQAYLSKADAKRVARLMSARERERLHLYRCPWCHYHHVGHLGARRAGVPSAVGGSAAPTPPTPPTLAAA